MQPGEKAIQRLRIRTGHVFVNRLPRQFTERLVVHVAARDADDEGWIGQLPVGIAMEQRR